MKKRRNKIPQAVVRKVQVEIGIKDNNFTTYVDIANVIADMYEWPRIIGKNNKELAKKYIRRYLLRQNEVKITSPLAFVYFIQAGGFVKIGVTVDIDKRMKGLQTSNPHKLTLLASIPMRSKQQAYSVENQLHKKFEAYRVNGEWFSRKIIPKMLDIKEHVEWIDCNHSERVSRRNFYLR